jgi:2-iminobutanoate/2-iminopropanoate deaminase
MEIITTIYSVRDGGHYTPGIKHHGILYISGQLSIDPETGRPAGDVKAETAQALENLDRVLKSAGIEKEAVIQCRIYTPDVGYWSAINEVYAEYFGNHKPARVVVPTAPLYGGCKVEIEAIAACD